MKAIENGELSEIYRSLAEQYLIEKYSVKRLDERFGECKAAFIPEDDRTDNGLKYISVLNSAHMERLSEEEIQIFRTLLTDEDREEDLVKFIISTCDLVMAGDIRKSIYCEYYKDIHGNGIFPGNAVIFCFRDQTRYDENGKMDWAEEGYKNKVFNRVKLQFEQLAGRKEENPVYLIRR